MTAPGSTVDGYALDDFEGTPRVTAAEGVFSVGAYLSAQRRLRGMSLSELEAVTRIPQRSLARLEAGAFDRQHDAFVRGFVRTVAVAIGLDPGDTLVRMLTGEAPPRVRRRRVPLRLLALPAAGIAIALLAFWIAASGRLRLAQAEGPPEAPEAGIVLRRDYVRELAQRVREATPGSFARPVAVAPPPAMYVMPASETSSGDDPFALPPSGDEAGHASTSLPGDGRWLTSGGAAGDAKASRG